MKKDKPSATPRPIKYDFQFKSSSPNLTSVIFMATKATAA